MRIGFTQNACEFPSFRREPVKVNTEPKLMKTSVLSIRPPVELARPSNEQIRRGQVVRFGAFDLNGQTAAKKVHEFKDRMLMGFYKVIRAASSFAAVGEQREIRHWMFEAKTRYNVEITNHFHGYIPPTLRVNLVYNFVKPSNDGLARFP